MKHKIIVFLPAHNEEATIADVIAQVPRQIAHYDVEVLVIDDGSSDRTVEVASAAGADHIVSFANNRGLGAAVREGLRVSDQLGAELALMIDADNEYPASHIPQVLAPIIANEADYTMGSRFSGPRHNMRIHRRIGNYLFTLLQSVLLHRWISDGQSGMRGFSRAAMRDAEIIHDYNYAQVLTINLLRKGYRLVEVPIPYRIRTTGQSFISFRKYMKHVIPAVWKEYRRPLNQTTQWQEALERK
jgi:glycosyltransferase involved in cell wall biosynthesis